MKVIVEFATVQHLQQAEFICNLIAEAAKVRGTGIALRKPEYIREKINQGNAVIAFTENLVVGFCYIETWNHGMYVVNSGLVVHPDFRKTGLARRIKEKIFSLSKDKYPNSKIFGITTSLAVMKINSDLGYKPVTFSELTREKQFWNGCKSCPNYDILTRTNQSHCLCTGMLYTPLKKPVRLKEDNTHRWDRFKRFMKLHKIKIGRKVGLSRNKKIKS